MKKLPEKREWSIVKRGGSSLLQSIHGPKTGKQIKPGKYEGTTVVNADYVEALEERIKENAAELEEIVAKLDKGIADLERASAAR